MVVDIFITIIIIITAMLPIILMIIVTAGIWEGGPWNVQVWKEFTKKMRSIEFSPNFKWSMFSFRGETRTLLVPPGMGYGERGVPNVSFVLWGCFHVLLFTVIHFDKTFVVWRWFLCVFFLKTFVVSQVIPGGATLHFTVELLSISDGPPLARTREL